MAIRPPEGGLAMHQLRFKAEVRAFKELGVEPAPVSDGEMKLAEQLVDHLRAKRFDPNDYVDEFKGRVEAAIQEKVRGNQISLATAPAPASAGNIIDLMAALRASLSTQKARSAEPEERKAPKRAPAQDAARKPARRRGA